MDNRHIIEQAVIDISFGCEEEAFEQQTALSTLARSRLMGVVDEVFNEMSPGGEVCRIESLEIDLGTMDYINFPAEMESRLRERLKLVVQEKLLTLRTESAPRSGIVPRQRVELEHVAYFLISGRLPWNASLGKVQTVEQMLRHVLHSSGEQFAEFLRRSAQGVTAVQRLVRQFPEEILSEVLQVLAPSHARFLACLVEDLHTLRKANGFAKAGEVEFSRFIWEQLILELRKTGRTVADPKDLLGLLVKRIALHEGGHYLPMLTALVTGAAQVEQWAGRRLTISGLLQSLLDEGERHHSETSDGIPLQERTASSLDDDEERVPEPRASTGAAEERSAEIAVLRRQLAEALVRGKAEGIQDIWHILLREQPELLKAALREHGQQARVRRQIARDFPEPMIRDILELLEPTERRFIAEIVGRPQLFQRSPGEPPAHRKRQLWEFTLTYLLVERGSRFNKRAYLGSLVRQMAAHDNLRGRDLLRALTEGAPTIEAPTALKDELLQLLGELAAEPDMSDGQPAPADAGDDSRDLIRAFDLYDALHAGLLQGVGIGDQGLGARDQGLGIREEGPGAGDQGPGNEEGGASLIEALEQEAPWLLLRLYRELQAGARSGVKLAAQLSEDALHRLLTAFLAIMPQAGADGRAELLRAIDTNARRVADPRRFYEQILECLLRDEPIDFDALLTETRSGSQADREKEDARALAHPVGEKKQSDGPVEAHTSPQLSGQLEEELTQHLKEDARVSPEEAARLIQTIEHMLAQQPGRLRQLAEPLLEYPDAAGRLIDLLPERLLTRILALLRASAHNQAQRCAELIATACAGLASAPELGQLRRLKWQFLFRYLLEEGRPFDEGVFVRSLVVSLAEQMHGPDATEFPILLCRELTLTTLPSTRDWHRAIIDALSQTVEAKPQPGAASPAEPSALPDSLEEEERDYREQIYIANAGLVLAAPYLPRLFAMLNLTENSVFADPNAAERAVHLLQFMVNERTDAPEYQLVLNKILCGVRTGVPIERKITISDQEQETIEGLLQGMIQNWKSIGQTSIAGLRESFLQREGRLQLRENAWHLLVEPRAFDMLLDQIPWSFSMIKHPWMERILYVEWR